jgi:hypothetical protein
MTMTRPCRRITLHLSQIFFTDGWTFTGAAPHSSIVRRPRTSLVPCPGKPARPCGYL